MSANGWKEKKIDGGIDVAVTNQLSAFPVIFWRTLSLCLVGPDGDRSRGHLASSVLENTRPMIETAPLEQAAEAYARMMQGKARFCWVLVTKDESLKWYSLRHAGEHKEEGDEYV